MCPTYLSILTAKMVRCKKIYNIYSRIFVALSPVFTISPLKLHCVKALYISHSINNKSFDSYSLQGKIVTGNVSPFWRLQFSGGSYIFFFNLCTPYLNSLQSIFTLYPLLPSHPRQDLQSLPFHILQLEVSYASHKYEPSFARCACFATPSPDSWSAGSILHNLPHLSFNLQCPPAAYSTNKLN